MTTPEDKIVRSPSTEGSGTATSSFSRATSFKTPEEVQQQREQAREAAMIARLPLRLRILYY